MLQPSWIFTKSREYTSAGTLPYKEIIHVAGINLCWIATEYSVRQSVRLSIEIVNHKGFKSLAFPVIGSGSGNRSKKWSLDLMLDEMEKLSSDAKVYIVEYSEQ